MSLFIAMWVVGTDIALTEVTEKRLHTRDIC